MRLFLVGMPGSGKTKVGSYLSSRTGLSFFDLDGYIVKKDGRTINAIFEQNGEAFFRELEHACLKEINEEFDDFVLATGGGAPCYFNNMEFMNAQGITVFLDVPIREIAENMVRKGTLKRPLLKDVHKDALLGELEKKYEERIPFYLKSRIAIRGGLGLLDQRVEKIVQQIKFPD